MSSEIMEQIEAHLAAAEHFIVPTIYVERIADDDLDLTAYDDRKVSA